MQFILLKDPPLNSRIHFSTLLGIEWTRTLQKWIRISPLLAELKSESTSPLMGRVPKVAVLYRCLALPGTTSLRKEQGRVSPASTSKLTVNLAGSVHNGSSQGGHATECLTPPGAIGSREEQAKIRMSPVSTRRPTVNIAEFFHSQGPLNSPDLQMSHFIRPQQA